VDAGSRRKLTTPWTLDRKAIASLALYKRIQSCGRSIRQRREDDGYSFPVEEDQDPNKPREQYGQGGGLIKWRPSNWCFVA